MRSRVSRILLWTALVLLVGAAGVLAQAWTDLGVAPTGARAARMRASPLDWVGPERWYPPVIPLGDLPPIDVVLISHDHYDHLQTETIQALARLDCAFVVPLGVGADLEAWGVPPDRITELDWWEQHSVRGVAIHATPARHASGRQLFDQNRTLWASYALVGPRHRVYFSGDTGLFSALDEIGARLDRAGRAGPRRGGGGRGRGGDAASGPERRALRAALVGAVVADAALAHGGPGPDRGDRAQRVAGLWEDG